MTAIAIYYLIGLMVVIFLFRSRIEELTIAMDCHFDKNEIPLTNWMRAFLFTWATFVYACAWPILVANFMFPPSGGERQ